MYSTLFRNDHLFIGVGIVLFACFIENLVGKVAAGRLACERHISRGHPCRKKSSSLMNKLRGQMHFSFTRNPLSLEMSGWWVCVVNLQAI